MSVPIETAVEMAVLKGIAAHYVMRADDRLSLMERQRTMLAELVEVLLDRAPDALERRVRRRLARRRATTSPGGAS